jgi:hypothetical protein
MNGMQKMQDRHATYGLNFWERYGLFPPVQADRLCGLAPDGRGHFGKSSARLSVGGRRLRLIVEEADGGLDP